VCVLVLDLGGGWVCLGVEAEAEVVLTTWREKPAGMRSSRHRKGILFYVEYKD
jgi:hypothetical protein